MKEIILVMCFLFASSLKAQNASVEKSIYGIQTGFLGIWVQNEARLSNSFALRTELGLDAGFNSDLYVLAPSISIEPRYYYNLERRVVKGKNIKKNSANFVTVRFNYITDGFAIANQDNVRAAESYAIIPKYGLRRMIGSHFNYELGLGIGYRGYTNSDFSETGVDLHLRIGYTF